jgi:hypothetical protein
MARAKRKETKDDVEKEVTDQVGVYYMEDPAIKHALQHIAVDEGHNSLSRIVRRATKEWLRRHGKPKQVST